MSYGTDAAQFKAGSLDQVDYMSSHGQVHVKRYPKISSWVRKRTVEFPTMTESRRGIEFEILAADMISVSVLSSLSFSFVAGHPRLDVIDALLHGLNEYINLLWRGRSVQLSVTSKRMMTERVAVPNIREMCGSQDKSLWVRSRVNPKPNPVGLHSWWSLGQSYSCLQLQLELCLWGKKRTGGEQYHVCQDMFKMLEKNGMVYCIKGSR